MGIYWQIVKNMPDCRLIKTIECLSRLIMNYSKKNSRKNFIGQKLLRPFGMDVPVYQNTQKFKLQLSS